jgi:hypothetical protein
MNLLPPFAQMALFFAVFLLSCTNAEFNTGDTLSLDSLPQAHSFFILPSENQSLQRVASAPMPDSAIPNSREDLSKMRMIVRIYNGKDYAGLSLPGFGFKLGRNESSLHLYYLESKVVETRTDTAVYGCGYSIHYLFRKLEAGIDIQDLPSVAASAQLNSHKTQVYYCLQSYGMRGGTLVRFFKPVVNKKFDVEGFGAMQRAVDGIHQILSDSALSSAIHFNPERLRFVQPFELFE